MDVKKLIVGTLVGGVVSFILGYLFYGILMTDFFESHVGSATGLSRGMDLELWAIFLGNCAHSALLSVLFTRWVTVTDLVSGLRKGFAVGLLVALGMDLTMYGTTNAMDLTATLVDPIVYGVMLALTGGFIGLVFGKMK